VVEKVSTRKENKRSAIRKNHDDRSLCVLTDVHFAEVITEQRFCAGVRYDSHGSPAWRNNCTRSTRSSLVAVLDDRCRRDSLVAIIHTESCRRISRTPLPVRKSRPPSSNANQRYPDGLHRQKSDSQSHIWVLGRNNASLRLA